MRSRNVHPLLERNRLIQQHNSDSKPVSEIFVNYFEFALLLTDKVFVIAGGGFGFLWWQGIIQPFLKEIACYVAWKKHPQILSKHDEPVH